MGKDLLFEIGTEEIPARFMEPAFSFIESYTREKFKEYRIDHGKIKVTGTPRRLVLFVEDVSERQARKEEEIIGPPANKAFDASGNVTKAGEGFARSHGVSVSDLKIKSTPKGEYVYIVKIDEGRETKEILPEFFVNLVKSIPWPKSMRWGSRRIRFARPIHWFLALFGSEVVEFEIEDIKSGNVTYGHRFLSRGPIVIKEPASYFSKLKENFVIVDHLERREIIVKQVEECARSIGALPERDEKLLDEVNFLVEYPVALLGSFEKKYLELPEEVLKVTMKEHQRYFPLVSKDGKLLPHFVVVANIITDDMSVIVKGNERVLKARLNDAKFFFNEDSKVPLEAMVEKLKNVVFQEKLGTSYEKIMRFRRISNYLAEKLVPDKVTIIDRCAYLCKADLESQMVYEFPELQGVMGRAYAYLRGENFEVAEGIFEHYLPRFAGDELPKTDAGAIVGIADRIDTIVGYFGIGVVPTGSEDPYGLRRDALAIIQIILNKKYRISLRELVRLAIEGLLDKIEKDPAVLEEEVLNFFRTRIYHYFVNEGIRGDVVDAVLDSGFDDIVDVKLRVEALYELSMDEKFDDIMKTFKRVVNIIPDDFEETEVDETLFEKEEERALYRAILQVEDSVKKHIMAEDYKLALKELLSLKPVVDSFFDNVLVMDKDERKKKNRLSLLNKLGSLFKSIANLKRVTV